MIVGGAPRPRTTAATRKARSQIQKETYRQLQLQDHYDAQAKVRTQLHRFGHQDRRQAERAVRRLRHLAGTVPSQTWAAIHGAVWNRWATARRRQATCSRCLVGCEWGEDSLQHYRRCRTVPASAADQLALHRRHSPLGEHLLLVAPDDMDTTAEGWWEGMAILAYAVMRITNTARASARLSPAEPCRAF